jgi:predicted nucleic acid-binding protein
MRAYIDADVLIWYLRGEPKARQFLSILRDKSGYELWTGAMQRAEVVFFMRPHEERVTLSFLANLRTASVDQTVVDAAARLYREWHPSHGVDINDCILAATTLHTGGKICCLNTKHYPMPDLIVERAW